MGIEESQECAGDSGGLFAEGRDLPIAWLGTFVDIRDVRVAVVQTERDTLQVFNGDDSHGGSVRVAGGGAGGINLP